MSSNTKIKFKRSAGRSVSNLNNLGERLEFGEPLLINDGKYLVLGPSPIASSGNDESSTSTSINQSIFFKGQSKQDADKGVKYNFETDLWTNNSTKVLVAQNDDEEVTAKKIFCNGIITNSSIANEPPNDKKYYLLCNDENSYLYNFNLGSYGIYVDGLGVLHGAAWNDYAENREYSDEVTLDDLCGRVVCEDGHGKLRLSRERLQPCPYVVSDTFGVTIGEGNIPVAVAGRVLVYIDDEVELGDCVAAGFNGKAVKMTRQEIINYPDRILGTVIEIPDYDKFNDKSVNGRVWIRVK